MPAIRLRQPIFIDIRQGRDAKHPWSAATRRPGAIVSSVRTCVKDEAGLNRSISFRAALSVMNSRKIRVFDYFVVSWYNHPKELGLNRIMPSQQLLVDLHMHSFLSDGDLLPSELAQRCIASGYGIMAITDHVGPSNIDELVEAMCKVAEEFNSRDALPIKIIPGVELTHVIPETIAELTDRARSLGARIVVMHGETAVEPVPEGTNRAAIEAGVDMIAHPGLITRQEVELAREHGVALEITTRRGHSLTNGHVARLAREIGATLVLNSDTHSPGNILTPVLRERTILGAGLGAESVGELAANSLRLAEKLLGKA